MSQSYVLLLVNINLFHILILPWYLFENQLNCWFIVAPRHYLPKTPCLMFGKNYGYRFHFKISPNSSGWSVWTATTPSLVPIMYPLLVYFAMTIPLVKRPTLINLTTSPFCFFDQALGYGSTRALTNLSISAELYYQCR
jgi:hypothetical protein